MSLETHNHTHEGIYRMTWNDFGRLCRELSSKIWTEFQPDVVVGIAKGGVLVGAALASAMQKDFFPIKLSSRHDEIVVRKCPEWFVKPTRHLKDKKVLLVDDISVSRHTIDAAQSEILRRHAKIVKTATLLVHGGSLLPDWFGLKTDALVMVPWDTRVIREGKWILNPEFKLEIDKMKEN